MALARVNGLTLGYEIIGDTGPAWIVTPGGRFSKDKPGVRELASDIAAYGNRVVIWDRPNCGESDVCFDAEFESVMQADCLAGLIRHLGLGPTILAGGSAGARVSMLATARHPEVVRALALWWITGGIAGYIANATVYGMNSYKTAWLFGMEGVANLPEWQESIQRNPGNRQRILEQDRDVFVETMQRWMRIHIAGADEVVAGMTEEEAGRLTIPSAVVLNPAADSIHLRSVSQRVADVLPNATMLEWPWPTDGSLEREAYNGTFSALFTRWREIAPALVDWARQAVFTGQPAE